MNRLAEPERIRIRVDERVEGPFPEEVAISISLKGSAVSAFVPADAVEDGLVRGLKLAETHDCFLIALPPGSIRSPYFWVEKSFAPQVIAP